MSKDEKKSSLADLLEEYFPGAGQKAEQVLNEMFGGESPDETEQVVETARSEQVSEVPEAAAENVPEEEPVEIIALDGDEDDDIEDVPDEPIEVPEEAEDGETEILSTLSQWSDWADEAIAASAAASETFSGTETTAAESETEEEPEAAFEEEDTEESDYAEEAEEDNGEPASKEEASEAAEKEEITDFNEDEDINEKWLAKFAKGIFPVKGDSVWEVIRKIIFLAAVIVFIGAGIMLASTLIQSKKAQEIQSSVRDIIETTVASYIDENGNIVTIPPSPEDVEQRNKEIYEIFKAINEDYIGYVVIEGCDIYEPVVKGEDNKYYLKNNIYGEQNKAGTVFMDYRCTVTSEYTSPNLVIYGHNQEDGTMFGKLKNYKVDYNQTNPDIDFYKNNPVIKFTSEFESSEYLIYGFFVTNALENQDSNGEVFHYHDYIETMNDEYTFNWYQGEVQKRNQIISPVDVQFGDKLLVLSTCSNEFTQSRFVVFARKLREGESVSDYDFSEARRNPNPKGVDWEAILSGETSATEVPESEEEILDDFTTHSKSLNKRNEKTYTTATEEEEETTTKAPAATTAAVTTVPVSETSETETETAGSAEGGEDETTVPTDENGEPVTDELDSETSDSEAEAETTAKRKKKTETSETSETSEVVTSKKKSSKKNR